jgi:hypothetical protein
MKNIISILGALLIILGIIGFTYKYYTYTTTEKVAEIGNVKITAQEDKVIFLSPTVSAIMLISGLILVVVGVTRK